MNTQLKAKIEIAINEVIQSSAEDNFWQGFIHDELAAQMTNAAEAVFDAAMKAQEFAEDQK